MHNPRIPHHLLSPALQRAATMRNAQQHTATRSDALRHAATHCNTRQHTATNCNTLQHTATHCNTLHRDAKHAHRQARSCRSSSGSPKIDLYPPKTPRDTHEQHIIQNKNTYVHIHVHINVYVYEFVNAFTCRWSWKCLKGTNLDLYSNFGKNRDVVNADGAVCSANIHVY